MTNTLIVCGLTQYENQIIKDHKGECRYCMYYESFLEDDKLIKICEKDGKRKLLFEEKTDCPDWFIDTR